ATFDLYTVRGYTARELWQMGREEMGGGPGGGGGEPAPLGLIAFLTPSTFKGDFGGSTLADSLCESFKPPIASGKSFKAFVFDSSRSALSAVLQASTTYYQPDGQTPWFSTDGFLQFTSIDTPLSGAPKFWTGLVNGNPGIGDACQNWSDSTILYNGYTWDAAAIETSSFTTGTPETCDSDRSLLCIEQLP
ncbi:MAG TPA: DUF1554 domain-containing protein, partial [Turneriella sp.]|nr:DUF1554 domain-containing protein [Turneriella sp.]